MAILGMIYSSSARLQPGQGIVSKVNQKNRFMIGWEAVIQRNISTRTKSCITKYGINLPAHGVSARIAQRSNGSFAIYPQKRSLFSPGVPFDSCFHACLGECMSLITVNVTVCGNNTPYQFAALNGNCSQVWFMDCTLTTAIAKSGSDSRLE